MRDGMRQRKCGCIKYDYGPPLLCNYHKKRSTEKEEKTLRRAVADQVRDNGHELTPWREYPNVKGKYTAYCYGCGVIAIVYNDPPTGNQDQVSSWILNKPCSDPERAKARKAKEEVDGPQEEAESMEQLEGDPAGPADRRQDVGSAD